MIGQYPFAALVGKVIDEYGPWACSLIASVFFSTGFGLFAAEVSKTPDDIAKPSKSSFRILALCFFLTGLGTVSSYVSSLSMSTPPYTQKVFFVSFRRFEDFSSIFGRCIRGDPGILWFISALPFSLGI
jgi:hypothetical protein